MNASNPRAYTLSGIDSMQADSATPLQLAPVGDKAVDLDFAGGRLFSDAGLVLLTAPDEPLGLTRALAAVLSDPREARRVNFTPHDLRKQRVCQMAAGYEDANDANTCATIPSANCCVIACRKPVPPWPLQPTLSRFEHRVSRTALSRMALVLGEQFLASSSPPPQVIVLDVDDTEDRAHGRQEQARYDAYSGGYCFLPLTAMQVSQGALSPLFSRPSVSPVPRGWRCANAWASGASRLAPPPGDWRAVTPLCLSLGQAVDRRPSPSELCDRMDQQCRLASVGAGGGRTGPTSPRRTGARAPASTRRMTTLGRGLVAPRGHQGEVSTKGSTPAVS